MRRLPRIVAPFLVLALLTGCGSSSRTMSPADARIDALEQQLEQEPSSAPLRCALAVAWLERARWTHQPDDVRRARAAAEHAVELEPDAMSFVALAAIENFAHRFDAAAAWGHRAVEAAPRESAAIVQLVEANLGRGRIGEARALIPPLGKGAPDFGLSLARARVAAASGAVDEAVAAYLDAAEDAAARDASRLVAAARLGAAGVLVDAGRLDEARRHLQEVERIDADSRMLQVYRAEAFETEGRHDEAAAIYTRLLEGADDPTLHARLFRTLRAAGRDDVAQGHYERARDGFQAAIDAGEVYTLGALAALYLTAGTESAAARDLARRNLEHTRTPQAMALLTAATTP